MLKALIRGYERYLGSVEAGQLAIIILCFLIAFAFFGRFLFPVFLSIALAYLLEQIILFLTRHQWRRGIAVHVVFLIFLGASLLFLAVVLPTVIKQASTFLNNFPDLINWLQETAPHKIDWLKESGLLTEKQVVALTDPGKIKVYEPVMFVLKNLLSLLPNLFNAVMYLIIVPTLLYFLLIGKPQILEYCVRFMPKDNLALKAIWEESYAQLKNYTQGKVLEIFLMGGTSYLAFMILGLNYPVLLSVVMALSTLLPYVGGIIATLAVLTVGFIQWGLAPHFFYLLIVYAVIMGIDSTLLPAILFSEKVALHPFAIIVSILFFGGLWGIWGLFFAIPLAAFLNALIHHWPIQD